MKRLADSQPRLAALGDLATAEDGRRLARLLFAGSSVLYACRPDGEFNATFISPNAERLLGWRPEEFTAEPGFWRRHVHPEDLPQVERSPERLTGVDHVSYDYRFQHGDGRWLWIKDEAFVWRDGDGRTIEITGALTDITANRQALEHSERRLEDAIECLDDGFTLFDADDRLVLSNSRCLEFYAGVADAIRPGMRFIDILQLSVQRGLCDLGGMTGEAWISERMAWHHAGGRLDQRLSDGRYLDIREHRTSDGGSVAIRRDVTEARTLESALREALAFEQALIDALPIPVYYKVPDGRYLAINKAFEQALGIRREKVLGHTNFDFLRRDYADAIRASDEALMASGGRQTYETRIILSDGKEHDLLVNKAVFHDFAGRQRGWVGSLVDVTEIRRTEGRLLQAAKLATLGQIASEVAHELNQPLSIVRMTLDNLRDHLGLALPADVAESLGVALRQVDRMADIVGHLRVYSRGEHQDSEPFSPVETITSAVRMMTHQLQAAGIELHLEAPTECPPALGKAGHLEQVLLNLLANARDAVLDRPQPGQPRRITVRVREAVPDHAIRVTVEDNGGGVPTELWERIYEPFFTTKAEGRGTGLGLSISADIMRQLGGSLSGTNTMHGARFDLVLPLLAPDRAAVIQVDSTGATPAKAEAAPGRHLLVVDDEPEALQVMADFLRRHGHRVTVAGSGPEALRLISADPCDVLISDLRMPHMPGDELARRLRIQRPKLPVVLMTGQVDVTDGDMERAGFVLIRKPVSLRQLIDVIGALEMDDG